MKLKNRAITQRILKEWAEQFFINGGSIATLPRLENFGDNSRLVIEFFRNSKLLTTVYAYETEAVRNADGSRSANTGSIIYADTTVAKNVLAFWSGSAWVADASVSISTAMRGALASINGEQLVVDGVPVPGPPGSNAWSDITSKPTTLGGYGITDAATAEQGSAIDLLNLADTRQEIQQKLNSLGGNGASVTLPRAEINIDAPLITGNRPANIKGSGDLTTRFVSVTPGQDALQNGYAASPGYFARLSISDVCFTAATAAGTAIKAKFDRNAGGITLENVRFTGFGAGLNFEEYVSLVGASNSIFRNVTAFGSVYGTPAERAAGTQIGFRISSYNNDDKSYVYLMDNTTVEAEETGWLFEVLGFPGNSGSLEGVIFNKGYGRSNTGAWVRLTVPNSSTVWKPPYWVFRDCNWQGPSAWMDMQCPSDLTITACSLYVEAPLPMVGGGFTPTMDTIKISKGKGITIKDLVINLLPGAKIGYAIRFEACENIVIDNIHILCDTTLPAPTIQGGILIDTDCINVSIGSVTFGNWPAGVPKITDGFGSLNPAKIVTDWNNTLVAGDFRSRAGNTNAPENTQNYYGFVKIYDNVNGVQYVWAQGASDLEYQREFFVSGGTVVFTPWVLQWGATGRSLAAAASAAAARTVLGLATVASSGKIDDLDLLPVDLAKTLGSDTNRLATVFSRKMSVGGLTETAASMAIKGAAGSTRELVWRTGDVTRASLNLDNSAEGGSNTGSNPVFSVNADNGAFINFVFTINRASAVMSFAQPPKLPSYTVAAANALVASAYERSVIYVSNGASNKRLAVGDGANFRFPDGPIIS